MPSVAAPSTRRSFALLLGYAVAHAGAVIGYLPLLSLLLPMKVERIAGDARLGVLTACILTGALVASAANVLFGWLSDRRVGKPGGRRAWLVVGAAGLALSYILVSAAGTPGELIAAIAAFQLAVNALLAPLFALMAEEIPDAQKGTAGGLLALAAPVAAGVSALLVGSTMLGEAEQLGTIVALVALFQLPVLALPARPAPSEPEPAERPRLRGDFAIAWGARLLVQVAGNALSLYLLYYFASVVAGATTASLAGRVGNLLTLGYALPLPVAVLVGRWSDRTGRRKPFLLASALFSGAGLAMMAQAGGWEAGAIGFVVYAMGSTVFLGLHAGFAMQLLPSAAHRGRDLGLLNLANTMPALVGPLLTWWLATPDDFGTVMAVLAVLSASGGVAMMAVRGRR